MSTAYKIVARYPKGKQLQWKKKLYVSTTDFNKYALELMERWKRRHDLTIYRSDEDEEWVWSCTVESSCHHKCENCDECNSYSNRIDS